jgi:hypothetical protein
MTPVPLDARFHVARDVQSRRFHEEVVVLDLRRGEYFSLNEVGARVWDALSSGTTLREVIETLAVDYDTSVTQLSVDVLAVVEDLLRRELVVQGD